MIPPSSQKADVRPISFLLKDTRTGQETFMPLSLRPEDLTREEPSLQTARVTLGGAFVDDFGVGLTRIEIAGTTGWRGDSTGDGIALFQKLHQAVWLGWRAARAAAVAAGASPGTVKLIFADALDDIVSVVAPSQFVLKRSRARPLLAMYQIRLVVLSDDLDGGVDDPLDFGTAPGGAGDLLASGSDSLAASIGRVQAFDLATVEPAFAASLAPFLTTASGLFGSVLQTVNAGRGSVDPVAATVAGLASGVALAGRNAAYAYGAGAYLDVAGALGVSRLAATFENALCVLNNAFRGAPTYLDYSALYGASVCSSTVGGSPLSPLSGVNPFEVLISAAGGGPSVTPEAQAAIASLGAMDPVFSPPSADEIGGGLSAIAAGIVSV